ncbi:hypothetical protein EYF80_043685 [Liparis tanakae]|uniref:Uncharacterized protein n=1 Tax=Liparis tanakae TaxID=230148 RepID=A0A4Z2FXS3_9TELE|nr:hypothetical protein EYF80_043685 [Liparis tanakae]
MSSVHRLLCGTVQWESDITLVLTLVRPELRKVTAPTTDGQDTEGGGRLEDQRRSHVRATKTSSASLVKLPAKRLPLMKICCRVFFFYHVEAQALTDALYQTEIPVCAPGQNLCRRTSGRMFGSDTTQEIRCAEQI